MDAPVGDLLVDRRTNDTARDFLTKLLDDRPAYMITTDGTVRRSSGTPRSGASDIQIQRNAAPRSSGMNSGACLPLHCAAAFWRFETVPERVEQLASRMKVFEETMKNFDKVVLYLQNEWIQI